MCTRYSSVFWVMLLFVALTDMVQAAEETKQAKTELVDPTGSWKWDYSFNDNPAEFRLQLNWDGQRLIGKYTAFNATTDVEEGKLENDQLSFTSKREFNGNAFTVHFK